MKSFDFSFTLVYQTGVFFAGFKGVYALIKELFGVEDNDFVFMNTRLVLRYWFQKDWTLFILALDV